jgi:hypothetical protein
MIKDFLYVLQRFKTSSIINILGLSVALIVFFVVLMQVHYDFTYDRGYPYADKIVQFSVFHKDGVGTSINFQIPAQINGSSETEIMLLLNRNILIQLCISFIIAIPIAYFVTFKWLENFAYKINIQGWVFLLGGFIVLIITLLTVSIRSYRAAIANPTKALNSE